MEILEELNFKMTRELKVGKWFIDFADIDRKIAIEIDGKQHELPERKMSDEVKDAYLTQEGWVVYRIKWKKLTKEFRQEVKNKLISILGNNSYMIETHDYQIGSRTYDENGDYHSYDDEPSYETPNGDKQWHKHGKLHRESGPAIEDGVSGYKGYYFEGKECKDEV